MKCLFNRAEKVTTEVEDLEGEREHLKEVFGWNGYPKSFISNSTNRDSTQDQSSADEVRVVIPYVRGLSEDIREADAPQQRGREGADALSREAE